MMFCLQFTGANNPHAVRILLHLLLQQVYTGVAGTMLGDLAAQLLSYSQASPAASSTSSSSRRSSRTSSRAPKPAFSYDVLRCGRLCLYSAAIGTPMGHYWYEVLEALVMPGSPTAPAAVASKVALDQLLQTPFGMALFFAVMKLLEGKPREVPKELRAKVRAAGQQLVDTGWSFHGCARPLQGHHVMSVCFPVLC
jgi:hypothetical protein